ncbi:MAG TPA: YCF48-related protein, partial [Candidatus Methylomirabilis sp.]|nr:YCF48-related protein [Candidatus Methylomirabilis sp.]
IYWTKDGGATWETASLPPLPAARRLDHLFALDAMTAWAVSGRGAILRSVDGGATWQLQSSGTRLDLAAIHFTDRQHGWAVGFANTVLKTTDGGLTWTQVQVNVP